MQDEQRYKLMFGMADFQFKQAKKTVSKQVTPISVTAVNLVDSKQKTGSVEKKKS